MGVMRRLVRFGGGLILGSAVGSAVSIMLAPQSGAVLRGATRDRLDAARLAGEEAELLAAEDLRREFRIAVNDPTALTGKFETPDGVVRPGPANPQEETARAKAQRQAREAEEAALKAEQDVVASEREAARARDRAAAKEHEAKTAQDEALKAR